MSQKIKDNIQEPNAPRNDFLPFANISTANVIDQAAYQSLESRGGGFVSGVAKSAQVNKVLRQSSMIAAAISQYIVNSTGKDVIDDGNYQNIALLLSEAVKKTAGDGVPVGGIISWAHGIDAIPAGYVLCNGDNNTPDLRDRFVIGAGGSFKVGDKGGSATISIDQMPAHTHTGSSSPAGGHSHGVNDGGHSHTLNYNGAQGQNYARRENDPRWSWGDNNWTNNPNNASTSGAGSNVSIQSVGDHTHNMSLDNTGGGKPYYQPYVALCFIMKT